MCEDKGMFPLGSVSFILLEYGSSFLNATSSETQPLPAFVFSLLSRKAENLNYTRFVCIDKK